MGTKDFEDRFRRGGRRRTKTTAVDPKGKPKRDEGTIDQGFENDLQGAGKRSMDVDMSLQVEQGDEEIVRAKEKEGNEEREREGGRRESDSKRRRRRSRFVHM